VIVIVGDELESIRQEEMMYTLGEYLSILLENEGCHEHFSRNNLCRLLGGLNTTLRLQTLRRCQFYSEIDSRSL
jgi:hypothetical protein